MTALGLDLGGTKLLAGVVEADGTVLATRAAADRRAAARRARRRRRARSSRRSVPALPVGVGVPALMDQRSGVAVRCVHLPLDGVPVVDVLHERLGVPVTVDNDATCAVLAEWRLGAARGCDHVALLTLGTGIGGGLVLDGRVYRGAVGAGGGARPRAGRPRRPALLRRLPGPRLPGGAVLGLGARARRVGAVRPRVTGEEVTRLALGGDADARSACVERLGDAARRRASPGSR